jgi:hypothetical protein
MVVMKELGPMCDRGDCGLVPHRTLMVGERNIIVRAVLTHQASLLG